MNPFDIQKRPSAVPGSTPQLSEMDKALLAMLAKQTGVDIGKLTRDYQAGDLSSLLSALPEQKRSVVQKIISDPAATEKAKQVASSDAVQKMMRGGFQKK